ncbi:hypothetical protein GG851_02605 [Bordetella petrii]|nr:hypothetical protein [Bordetella petrii]
MEARMGRDRASGLDAQHDSPARSRQAQGLAQKWYWGNGNRLKLSGLSPVKAAAPTAANHLTGTSARRPTTTTMSTGNRYPEFAWQLNQPYTRALVTKMLRNRDYLLQITSLKKDKGLRRVYVFDRQADPMLVQVGTFHEGTEPDWEAIYDAAMALHLERKRTGTRYGEW